MWKEFREFAVKGNVVDMAVGVIIGTAFSKIVSSLLADVLMPPVGLLLGRVDFSNLFISLNGASYPSLVAAKAVGASTLNYGLFLNTLIDFLIVALVIFLVIRQINRMRPSSPMSASPTTRSCPLCCSAIPLQAIRCAHCTADLTVASSQMSGVAG